MDHLWSPWRYQYVSAAEPPAGCIFCEKIRDPARDRENYVVHRAARNYIVLNLFPYTSGHIMVVPYQHAADLDELPEETLAEMFLLSRDAARRLRQIYRADGMNLGMNLGKAAGAGVAGHLHLHVLPRWFADANFMTTVGETRVLPEDLPTTYEKLTRAFAS